MIKITNIFIISIIVTFGMLSCTAKSRKPIVVDEQNNMGAESGEAVPVSGEQPTAPVGQQPSATQIPQTVQPVGNSGSEPGSSDRGETADPEPDPDPEPEVQAKLGGGADLVTCNSSDYEKGAITVGRWIMTSSIATDVTGEKALLAQLKVTQVNEKEDTVTGVWQALADNPGLASFSGNPEHIKIHRTCISHLCPVNSPNCEK